MNSNGSGNTQFGIRQLAVLVCLLVLALLILNKLMFMLSAFLGAVALYILFRRPHKYLVYRFKWKKLWAGIFLMSASLVLVLIPLYMIGSFLFHKLEPLVNDPAPVLEAMHSINAFINQYVEFSLISPGNLNKITSFAQTALPAILDSGLNLITNLIMMYFILWFMLQRSFEMERWLKINSPFRRRDTISIMNHIKSSVVSNAAGILLLGMIQGIVAMIGYRLFGVNEPILWGLITGACSVVPFVGTMLAYIPLSLLLMAGGQLYAGLGLLIFGFIIIGGCDNVFRFMLQKKLASTHPLITVLGVIAGLSLLGFWGLIYGPMMISLIILLSGIYREEFGRRKPQP